MGPPTLVAQEALPPVGAQAHGPLGALGHAGGPVSAGVPLAGAELAQLAGEVRRTLTEPVLSVAADRRRDGRDGRTGRTREADRQTDRQTK